MEGAHCLWKGAIVADLSQLLMTQKTSPLLSYQTNKSGRQYKSSVGIYLRTPCIHLCPCLGTESCARSDLLTNFGLSLESKSWEDRLFGALVGIYWDGVVGWVEVLGNLQGGGKKGRASIHHFVPFLFQSPRTDFIMSAEATTNLTDFSNGTADVVGNSSSSSSSSLCSNLAPDEVAESCKFWIQGVMLCAVGVVGTIGNLVSAYPISFWHFLLFFEISLS